MFGICLKVSKMMNMLKKLGVKLYIKANTLNCPKAELAFTVCKDLNKILKQNFDIVHINTASVLYAALVSVISRIHKVSIIIAHSHSAGAMRNNCIKKLVFPVFRMLINTCVTKKVACSRLAAEALFGKKYSLEALIIPNCIDANKYAYSDESRTTVREKYDLKNSFVIGQIARLAPEKNQRFLLNVLKRLINKDSTSRLLLVGDGPSKNELKKYAAKIGVDKFVIFAGNSNSPELFYSAMDVFLLPSIYEGFPITSVEAQASGLPCVFSQNITTEVVLTSDCSFLPIDCNENNYCEWVNKIMTFKQKKLENRHLMYQHIINNGYDYTSLKVFAKRIYGIQNRLE